MGPLKEPFKGTLYGNALIFNPLRDSFKGTSGSRRRIESKTLFLAASIWASRFGVFGGCRVLGLPIKGSIRVLGFLFKGTIGSYARVPFTV